MCAIYDPPETSFGIDWTTGGIAYDLGDNEMKEYVGDKLTRLEDWRLKFTQDVLVQSFKDEFKISDKKWSTPAAPGSVLEKVKEEEESLSSDLFAIRKW